MTDTKHTLFDPRDLAGQLPERPLRPEEVSDIADQLDLSVASSTIETESGQAAVPMWFAFAHADGDGKQGDALAFWFEGGEWVGEVERADVSRALWLEVLDAFAAGAGYERGELSITTDDGHERTLE